MAEVLAALMLGYILGRLQVDRARKPDPRDPRNHPEGSFARFCAERGYLDEHGRFIQW